MRQLIVATGILVLAASSHALPSSTASAPADSSPPPLTTTVVISPNDSPLVRAAKRAVASRQNPNHRRVITVRTNGTGNGRGRFAQNTGPVAGPSLPPNATPPSASQPWVEQAREKARQKAEVQEKLNQLEQQTQAVGAELDEPYGGDMEEDEVDARLSAIEAERARLQQAPPPPSD